MIHHKSTFFISLFILLTETFFGFPSSWKFVLIIISAVLLILLSIRIPLPRKNFKPLRRKEKMTPVFTENIPIDFQARTPRSSKKQSVSVMKDVTEDIMM